MSTQEIKCTTPFPVEVLKIIFDHADPITRLLAPRLSRAMYNSCSTIAFGNLTLTLPSSFPDVATLGPYEEPGGNGRSEAAAVKRKQRKKEIWQIQKPREVAFKERMYLISDRGNKQCWEKVAELTLTIGVGSADKLADMVQRVAPNLRRLTLRTHHLPQIDFHTTTYNTLDHFFMAQASEPLDDLVDGGYNLSRMTLQYTFPLLTFLTLGTRTSCTIAMASILTNSAPNLTSLDISLDEFPTTGDLDCFRESAYCQVFNKPCKLIRLRVHAGVGDGDQVPCYLSELLRASPLLEQVSIIMPDDCLENNDALEVYKLPAVRDVYLSTSRVRFSDSYLCDAQEASSVSRIVMRLDSEMEILESLPRAPDLVTVMYSYPPSSIMADTSAALIDSTKFLEVHRLLPAQVEGLRTLTPNLRHIHFIPSLDTSDLDLFSRLDTFQSTHPPSGSIQSMKRGDQEILIIRLFSNYVEHADDEYVYNGALTPPDVLPPLEQKIYMPLSSLPDQERRRIYRRLPSPTFMLYTDYQGVAVPFAIIERMRTIEGDKDWDMRGVEMSQSAWDVLTEWYAGPKGDFSGYRGDQKQSK